MGEAVRRMEGGEDRRRKLAGERVRGVRRLLTARLARNRPSRSEHRQPRRPIRLLLRSPLARCAVLRLLEVASGRIRRRRVGR